MIVRSFLKTTVFYGVSAAINKGLMLIALPFLGAVLTIEEYGVWTLSQIIISLGAPVFSLNGYSGILREGLDKEEKGYSSFVQYSKLTALVSLSSLAILSVFPISWLWYTIILICIESFQNNLLGWYRARDKHIMYFILVMLKLTALLFAVLILRFEPDITGIDNLLMWQTIFGAAFIMPLYLHQLFNASLNKTSLVFKETLIFSALLIPHGLAQWIMSGSDRLIIKHLLNNLELGKYSLAYSLAMVLMVVNSGLALTIPNFMIKNYEKWVLENKRVKILLIYSATAILINAFLVLFSDFLSLVLPTSYDIDFEIKGLIVWLSSGMYLLGIYFFYANILFYHKNSKTISTITVISALVNIVGTYLLVQILGIYGAAIITFFSYFIYLAMFIKKALDEEPRIINWVKLELTIVVCSLLLNFSLFYFI